MMLYDFKRRTLTPADASRYFLGGGDAAVPVSDIVYEPEQDFLLVFNQNGRYAAWRNVSSKLEKVDKPDVEGETPPLRDVRLHPNGRHLCGLLGGRLCSIPLAALMKGEPIAEAEVNCLVEVTGIAGGREISEDDWDEFDFRSHLKIQSWGYSDSFLVVATRVGYAVGDWDDRELQEELWPRRESNPVRAADEGGNYLDTVFGRTHRPKKTVSTSFLPDGKACLFRLRFDVSDDCCDRLLVLTSGSPPIELPFALAATLQNQIEFLAGGRIALFESGGRLFVLHTQGLNDDHKTLRPTRFSSGEKRQVPHSCFAVDEGPGRIVVFDNEGGYSLHKLDEEAPERPERLLADRLPINCIPVKATWLTPLQKAVVGTSKGEVFIVDLWSL